MTYRESNNGTIKRNTIIGATISAAVFAVCFFAGITGTLSNNSMRYMLQIFLYIVLGEMWNLLSGFAGMTSLGQQLFIGLSGYSVAMFTTVYKLPVYFGVAGGIVISLATAFIVALLLLRMRGMYYAITTWVVAEAASIFFYSWGYVNKGGGMNITLSPYPTVGSLYIAALILCALVLTVTFFLLKSKIGLGLTAMRDDTPAAASSGVNIEMHKLIVYLVAALFTSLAGSIIFINKGTIYPDSGFDISWTISIVFIVIIGGVGTIEGPVIGAVIYVLLSEFLAHFPGWSNIILGVVSILIIYFMPKGIAGSARKIYGFIGSRFPIKP